MNRYKVAIQKFLENSETVKKIVQDADAFAGLPGNAKVVVKPNIVVWMDAPYPKWGVVTTSVIVEETVKLLRDYGVKEIVIAEGSLQMNPKDKTFGDRAFNGLGYDKLKTRYGVKLCDVWEQPFEKVEFDNGTTLRINSDVMNADFMVNLPVLKTHAQVRVSLGIKNLKGFLDVTSRKKCHNADTEKDLEYMISRLPEFMPPSATIIDGIYTIERGPSFDGKPRRSNIVIASSDMLAADMAGAKVLGYDPRDIKYLAEAGAGKRIAADLSDIEIIGEKIEDVAAFHHYTFPYNEDDSLPVSFEKMGIKGLKFHKYDTTLCTYCSPLIGMLLTAIAMNYKKTPFDDVEFLTGKRLTPSPDAKKSILVGECMCSRNKDHEGPQQIVRISGCPPSPKEASEALKGIGIEVDPSLLSNHAMLAGFFLERFRGKEEFSERYYTIH